MSKEYSMLRREFVKSVGAAGAAMLMAGEVRAAAERPVGVALLGTAHMHTPMFLQMLTTRDDVKVVGVWDREPARAEKHARTCEAKVAKTPAEALADPAVKCVLVLSETSLHAELAVAAAKAGKHVFVEKPLGVGARDAFEIADAVEKAGVLFTTGYHLRTNPKLLFVKENLEQGKLGRIVRVECCFCNDTLLQDELDPDLKWITQRQWGSLGGFADTGTHALDMLMWLLGDVEAVSAEIRAVTNRYPGCDETGQGLVRFKNGVVGTISAGWIEPENPVSLLVCGTEGHAAMFNDRLHLRSKQVPGADGARPWGKLPPGPDHPVLQFVSAVAGQKDLPLVAVREAAKRVQAMEALYESAKQRKWVSVG